MFFKSSTVTVMLILPALIGMQDKTIKTIKTCESFVKHIIYLFKIWRSRYII